MTGRRVAALTAVLAVVLALAWGAWKRQQPERPDPSPLAGVPSADIERIDIVFDSTTTLVRQGGGWRLAAPVDDAADTVAVERLIGVLRDFTFGSVVSESAARHGVYEVNDASATRVTVAVAGSDGPALDLLVGKPTADLESSYVRRPGDSRVRTGDGLSGFLLRADAETLRDARLVPFGFDGIGGLSASWDGGAVSLQRSSAAWTAGGRTLEPPQITALERGFEALRIVDFGGRGTLGRAEADVIFTSGTARVAVAFGAVDKSRPGDPARRVKVEGRPSIMLVPETGASAFLAALRSLR